MLNIQLILDSSNKFIKITSFPFYNSSKNKQWKMKIAQGTVTAMLKQLIIESSLVLYQKLSIVGVGYWIFNTEYFEKKIFTFKLGYSHQIYFRASIESWVFCLKATQFFVYGSSFHTVLQTASLIWSYKKPEPYKGKGIFLENEKIILKEGKKI